MRRVRAALTPPQKRVYWVWAEMIQRCTNHKNPGFCRYGGRGITVCNRWRSFDLFFADMGLPGSGGMLERVNSSAGYSPQNCCWATRQAQNRNRPTWCRYTTINGQRLTMKEAWQMYAHPTVTYRALAKRVSARGWTMQEALTIPKEPRGGLPNHH